MNKQKYVLGTLLKAERLKQNKSQKEICFGICVNSYLSKIEHGIVKPDVEIMQKLYLRLNITITTDITLLNYFKDKIKEFYHAILYYLNTDIIYNDLMDYDQSLQFSEFCIDWLIIKTYHNIDCYQQLNALESCMLPKQKAYYYVISEEYVSTKEYLDLTMKAFHIMQNSYFLNILCGVYFLCGEYSKIHQCEDKLVSYTLEEGNTFQLANFYALNGTAYACLNQEEMMMHYYNRSLHFLQNTKWEQDMTYHIYYNIGSTYISSGKYALALSYLEKAKKEENITEFLLAHKFGVCFIRQGMIKEGKYYIEIMNTLLRTEKTELLNLYCLMQKELEMECEEHFLMNSKYIELLESLILEIEKSAHFGYLYFYKDYLIEAYMSQRKYKKALELERKVSCKINLSVD